MDFVLIITVAFAASILTFFSGFGMGTLLTPVFMLFFPAELAVALTGIVHLFNNLFKLLLVGRHADKTVLIRFGIPAVIAALAGSWLLVHIADLPPLFSYRAFGRIIDVLPVKFMLSLLLLLFAIMELFPGFFKWEFGRDKLAIGGLISGFFGGLSGNQGAVRSAFLVRAGLSKEAFIATAVVVSTFVDLTRLGVYSTVLANPGPGNHLPLLACATLAAITGALIGNKLLKKVTLEFLHTLVAILLIAVSIGLGAGLL